MYHESLFTIPREYTRQLSFSILNSASRGETSLQPTGTILKGEMNDNYLLTSPEGKLYVWRVPKESPTVLSAIHDELTHAGFLTTGCSYRFRSIPEQVDFVNITNQAGLKTLPILFTDGYGMLMEFVQGAPFDVYLRQGKLGAIAKVLGNMNFAHQLGIIFGDRWVKNTIVTLDEDIVEIDFDIALQGDYAREFEIAQTLYHIIHFSLDRSATIAYLRYYFSQTEIIGNYNSSVVRLFLQKYSEYFKDKEYEGIEGDIRREINSLITALRINF